MVDTVRVAEAGRVQYRQGIAGDGGAGDGVLGAARGKNWRPAPWQACAGICRERLPFGTHARGKAECLALRPGVEGWPDDEAGEGGPRSVADQCSGSHQKGARAHKSGR